MRIAAASLIDLTTHLPSPFLILDEGTVRANVSLIQRLLPTVQVFYAMKCNAEHRIVSSISEMKIGFEIASLNEAAMLLQVGIVPDKIACLHPIKSPELLRFLHSHQVRVLAADSMEELQKIARFAPGSCVLIRLSVPNEGSLIPLNRKFGVLPQEVPALIQFAYALGLIEYGITIHVGSQCENLDTWQQAIRICQKVCRTTLQLNPHLKQISLGGGLPVHYTKSSLSVAAVCGVIQQSLSRMRLPPDCVISIEPGRAVVASAGTLITTVIGLAIRGDERWAYLDAGIFHGLFEASQAGGGINYPVTVHSSLRTLKPYNLAGPTCDSFDVASHQYLLPELRIGDRLAFPFTGAYSNVMATSFNGFPAPAIYYLNDLLPEGELNESDSSLQ